MAYGVKHRLDYCNGNGTPFRLDIEIDGYTGAVHPMTTSGNPFVLSMANTNKFPKLETIRPTEATIEVFQDDYLTIDSLKTSDETRIRISHYIDGVLDWRGFAIPEFFQESLEPNSPITILATDRLGVLKNIPTERLYGTGNLFDVLRRCLHNTLIELSINVVAGFKKIDSSISDNPFITGIIRERLFNDKGESINCYDALKSILDLFNCFITQKSGYWWIVNKEQMETGQGNVVEYPWEYGEMTPISISPFVRPEVEFDWVNTGGERFIKPILGEVGILAEFGGSISYPSNNNFRGWSGSSSVFYNWTSYNSFVQDVFTDNVGGYLPGDSGEIDGSLTYPGDTNKLRNRNINFGYFGGPGNINDLPYLESSPIPIILDNVKDNKVTVDYTFNATTKNASILLYGIVLETPNTSNKYYVLNGSKGTWVKGGNDKNSLYSQGIKNNLFNLRLGILPYIVGSAINSDVPSTSALDVNTSGSAVIDAETAVDFTGCKLYVRIFGTVPYLTADDMVTSFLNSVDIDIKSSSNLPKGNIFKVTRPGNYTAKADFPTSIFSDYITNGLNGYFYSYPSDDTSAIQIAGNTSWETIGDSRPSPALLHTARQMSRLYGRAQDELIVSMDGDDILPISLFSKSCDEEVYTVSNYRINYLRSQLEVTLSQINRPTIDGDEYIYSFFGNDSSVKTIGVNSVGSGGGSNNGGGGSNYVMYAEESGLSQDSILWNGLAQPAYLTQPVRPEDSPLFTGISSPVFSSGIGGNGYRIAKIGGDYVLELDKLIVRKEFTVNELVVNKIRATNGSLWVSDAIKILEVEESGGDYVCDIDTDGGSIAVPFVIDDIVRCQVFNGSNVKYYTATVIAVTSDSFTITVIDGSGIPDIGDEVVRIGNTTDTDRQGALYLTASDSGSPYLDVIDGVTSASLSGKTKVRIGNLDGIVDDDFGSLSGYGIYAEDGYFKGSIYATSGKIGGFEIDGNSLVNDQANTSLIFDNLSGANTYLRMNRSSVDPIVSIGTSEINRIGMSIQTFASNVKGLYILNNDPLGVGGYAIDSYGGHSFYQRSGEVWNAPGVLAAANIQAFNGSTSVINSWKINSMSFTVTNISAFSFRITHNLGHTDYVCIADIRTVSGNNTISTNHTNNYVDITLSSSIASIIVNVLLIGRNKAM